MQIKLNIAGIGFCVKHTDDLIIRGGLKKYISEIEEEIQISIVSKLKTAVPQFEYKGEDMFCRYYGENDTLQIEFKGAHNSPSAVLFCENGMRSIRCEVYEQMQGSLKALDGLLSLLPMRQILYRFDAFIFHSSRIEVDGKAVLFTGPSGIGKTTQALLWKRYESACHLSNDRTILRKEKGAWKTYGYFEDGSEPIASNKCIIPGAIVVLGQAMEDRIFRLRGKDAFKALIEQVFFDRWDCEMFACITNMLLDLIENIPVYYLGCTQNRSAVECLKNELSKEGVINGNEDY